MKSFHWKYKVFIESKKFSLKVKVKVETVWWRPANDLFVFINLCQQDWPSTQCSQLCTTMQWKWNNSNALPRYAIPWTTILPCKRLQCLANHYIQCNLLLIIISCFKQNLNGCSDFVRFWYYMLVPPRSFNKGHLRQRPSWLHDIDYSVGSNNGPGPKITPCKEI